MSLSNYDIVMEMFHKTHAKNISHVVDEIITQYVNIISQHQRLVAEMGRIRQELNEAKQLAESYKTQLLTGVKL